MRGFFLLLTILKIKLQYQIKSFQSVCNLMYLKKYILYIFPVLDVSVIGSINMWFIIYP